MMKMRATTAVIVVLAVSLMAGCVATQPPTYESLLVAEPTSTAWFAETTAALEPSQNPVREPTAIVIAPRPGSAGAAAKTSSSSGSASTGGASTYPFGRCTASASPASPSIGGQVTLSVKVVDRSGAPLPGVAVNFISSYMPFPGEDGLPDPKPNGRAAATTSASGVASVTVRSTPYGCATAVQVQVNAQTGHNLAFISYTAR
ncbi:MAG: Ig-like domain-containing protein [Aeromicrobium sp.]|nr:Ig-like domain-containing protein [Aeromicrobium sp.]